jgi:hypothetical protein
MFNSCVFDWENGDSLKTSTNLSAGWNHITITHTDGCVVEDSLLMPEPNPVIDTFMVTDLTCAEIATGQIMVIPSDTIDSEYIWSTGDTTNHIQGLAAGAYELYVSDSRPCYDTLTFIVEALDTLVVNLTGADLNCFNDSSGNLSAQVNGGSGGYSFMWSSGDVTAQLSGVNAGIYALTVTDSLSCVKSDSITIVQPVELTVSVSSTDVLCFGGSSGAGTVAANGGSPGYAYEWSNGALQTTMNNVTQGNYAVTVTDLNGCTASEVVTIEEPNALVSSVSGSSITPPCNGTASTAITGGIIPYSYQWNDGQNTAIAVGLCAGEYTVTVTDANGCSVADTVVISTTTGILDTPEKEELRVYPNPTNGEVVFEMLGEENWTLRLYDVTGKLVYKQQEIDNERHNTNLNLSPGVYLYEILIQNQIGYSGKLMAE